ncbi:MAG: hypothetical protein H0W75_07195 [Chitinophagaceae bacterium]|nr:hypothetical protein [Chitinophagaceae bacterium]
MHNIFAKHLDNKFKKSNDKPYQLSNSGYNCDNNNVVVQSPFVNDSNNFEFSLFPSFVSYIFKNISFSSTSVIYSPLRGPPVNI